MSTPPLVPYTPILRRYHEVRSLHDEQRYALAQQLAADPGVLAADFAESIAILTDRYDNAASFHPKHRVPPSPTKPGINNGTDLAWYLHCQQRLPVTDAPELDAGWVEYELSVLGTRGAAVFDSPIYARARTTRPRRPAAR